MGYQTRYELTTDADEQVAVCPCNTQKSKFCPECGTPFKMIDLSERILQEIVKMLDYDPFNESCKWYEHEADMREFSKRYPVVLFTLAGEGEEAGDLWKKYFKNGKMQIAKAVITYDDFDAKKLSAGGC